MLILNTQVECEVSSVGTLKKAFKKEKEEKSLKYLQRT